MFGRVASLYDTISSEFSSPDVFHARVVDVIMDANHPDYETFGATNSLYGVKYKPINSNVDEEADEQFLFAYCQRNDSIKVPLKGEIVEIISQPDEDRDKDSTQTKDYWRSIVNFWNHPHHSASPITEENDFGDDFEEKQTINPLQLFPGDVAIEGRHGNTLRFGGTNFDSNPFSEDDNNGQPFIILKAGQKEGEDSIETVVEDPNEDKSSIYMTSDHIVELTQANEKRDAFEEEPEMADVHKGPQVIINSGRLFFNARDEGAFISANEMIGINAKVVGIDSDDYIGLDSKKIYLGTDAFNEDEPALKGDTTTVWLDDLVSLLEALANTMATTPPAPPTYIAALVKEGIKLKAQLPKLKNLLNNLHSKKVFIDTK